MKRSIKLDVRINIFDKVELNINSVYAPLPAHLFYELGDFIEKFITENQAELTDPTSTLPTMRTLVTRG